MTTVMITVSKSQLKSQLLSYLRNVEKEKKPVVVTHMGKPVAKIVPFKADPDETLHSLRGSVISYKDPTQPVGEEDWEVFQ
jgi:prevent-host-death family protein